MTVQKGFSKRDFSCGQYDREYQAAQTDISARGMIYSRNLISSPLGEIKSRTGSALKYVCEDETYMIPYRYNNRDVILAFSDKKMQMLEFLDDNTLVPFLGVINLQKFQQDWTANTTNGYTVADSNGSDEVYKAFNTNSSFKYAGSDSYWISFEAPNPFVLNKFLATWISSYTRMSNDPMPQGSQFKGFKNARVVYSDDGKTWTDAITTLTKPDGTSGIDTWQSTSSVGLPPTQSILTRNYIEYYVVPQVREAHKYWKIIFSEYVTPENPYSSFSYGVVCSVYTNKLSQNVSFETDIGIENLRHIKYSQYGLELKIATGNNPYRFSIADGRATLEHFIPDDPIWDTYGNPSAVCYFQNRLWWGGFSSNPTTVIGSAFGKETDYKIPDTIVAASPIVATCNQIKTRITDLFAGFDVLYAQCGEGIATIESGESAIAPNNMRFLLKVDKRSSGITPVVKDNLLFFVSESGDSIYAIQFDLIASKYQVSNVNTFCNSFLTKKIKELHYVDTQARLIYGLLQNGQMFAFLYDASMSRVGMFPFTTDGNVVDLSVAETADGPRLMAVIKRNETFVIEMFYPVKDLEDTDEFLQTQYEKNEATKRNLIAQPFIDCVTSVKDERQEMWRFDAKTQLLILENSSDEHIDFSKHPQDIIRFFTSSNRVYDLQIVGSPEAGQYNVKVIGGDEKQDADFVRLQMPIKEFMPELVIPNKVYQYFDSGQYKGNITADDTGKIVFGDPVYDLIFGFGYTKIGVIQDNASYLRKKKWGTIALNVMDTMSLQIGTKLDKMDNVMKWKGTDFFNSSPIMRNGILIKNISDSPENDKKLIFKTDEGLPFCIRAIEAGGEITDRNGN